MRKWRVGLAALIGSVLFVACSSDSSPVNQLAIDPALKRGPYVQMTTTDSALIVWQTFLSTQAAVEFGLTQPFDTRIEHSGFETTHAVSLTGLQPGTEYSYRVFDDDRPLSQIVSFRTNNRTEDTEFSFLVFGDSGTREPPMFDIANLINNSGASFALHTGDLVYPNGEEEYYDTSFFYPYGPFLAARVLYPSLGNHDLHTDGGAPYFRNFYLPRNNPDGVEDYYSFDYGHAHIVALDTNQSMAPGSAQRVWLESDLGLTNMPWKFVFFHHPPYSAGFQMNDSGNRSPLEHQRVRRDLASVFEVFGVNIVFAGHAHSYERTFPILQGQLVDGGMNPNYIDPHGPIYVVTGGGGGELTPLDASILNAYAVTAHHVVEVSISDNRLNGRAIGSDGTVLDEFSVLRQ